MRGKDKQAVTPTRRAAVAARAKDATEPTVKEKPLRPAQCRAFMRNALASEFPAIVNGFVKGAKSGSCQHVKLATELLAPPRKAKQRQTGRRTLARWVDEMERGV